MATAEVDVLLRGLPVNIDAERFLLGSVLLDGLRFPEVAADVKMEDFALEKHRRIYFRMLELHERGERVDRVTVSNELMRFHELESVDGLSYLVSLDEGMPYIPNIDGYIRIIREKSTLRQIAMSSQHTMNRALVGEEDPHAIIQQAFGQLVALSAGDKKRRPASVGSIVTEYPGGINAFLNPQQHEVGLKTGIMKFDEMTGGLRPKELVLLAARPSMGKTALAMQIGAFVALRGTPVFVSSLEMSRESLLQRIACNIARVDLHRFRSGWLRPDERIALREAIQRLADAPLRIDDQSRMSVFDFSAKMTAMKAEGFDVGLAIIDYLQLMETTGKSNSRNEDVSAISRGLKLLAGEMDIPIVALSQLSRASETRPGDHRPRLADLRDSGSLEQDADMVAFVFREEVYKQDREDLRGVAELIVAKQRNGPIGKVDLVFLHALTRFENRAEDLGGEVEG